METVLSCPTTVFYRNLFGLTESDLVKPTSLSKDGKKPNEHFDPELANRLFLWVIPATQSAEWLILPSREAHAIAPEFCLSLPSMKFFQPEAPPYVTISAEGVSHEGRCGSDWTLDLNEIFRHADQFTFSSGIFKDSTDVYFTANKGDVGIQFVFEGGSLKLYRVTYSKGV